MTKKKPKLTRARDFSGAYMFEPETDEIKGLKRYVAYVAYSYDKAALALDIDGLWSVIRSGGGYVEEIDINAPDQDEANKVAKAALSRDYDNGGVIVLVEEKVGWYM